jgi:hypothetical protein
MRKRNIVIAVVTGLGMIATAFALVLSPPTPEAEAQALRTEVFNTVTFLGIRDASTHPDPNQLLSIQGSEGGMNGGINIEFDAADEVDRWLIAKCYNMANKAMNKPGKFRLSVQCNDSCVLPSFIDCHIAPL